MKNSQCKGKQKRDLNTYTRSCEKEKTLRTVSITRNGTMFSTRYSDDNVSSTSSTLFLSSTRKRQVQLQSTAKMWWLPCLALVAVVARCDAEDVISQTNLGTQAVDKYLSTFGYYPDQSEENQQADLPASALRKAEMSVIGHTDIQRHHALERLQEFFHLPVSGQVDTNTEKIMKAARCGRKDLDIHNTDEDADNVKLGAARKRIRRYKLSTYSDGKYAKWNVSEMTWRITRPSKQISESQQRDTIRRSLNMWAQYVPIRFIEDRSKGTPDIDIQFVRLKHGPQEDPIFDGRPEARQNVLAHAWGPGYNIKGFAGDVHFDEDDDWTDTNKFLGVSVHELGHSMGLLHSDRPESIMYPVYREVVELAQDDIQGIAEMYNSAESSKPGKNESNTGIARIVPLVIHTRRPETRYTTQRPVIRDRTDRPDPRYRTNRPDPRYRTDRPDPRYRTDRPDPHYRTQQPRVTAYPRYRTDRPGQTYWTHNPDPHIVPLSPRTNAPYKTVVPPWVQFATTESPVNLCASVNVDAVFEDPTRGLYIVVSDENVHSLTNNGVLRKSELLKDVFPGVPMNPDVAFSISQKETVYFIKDDRMWAYKNRRIEDGYPRSLASLKFPERPQFSVTLPQKDGTPRMFLLGANYWWIFDVDRTTHSGYWPISSFSRELPRGIMFATQWTDNNLYAVTQDSYVVMDLYKRKIIQEKPIAGKPEWLQALCGDASKASLSIRNMAVFVGLASVFRILL